MKKLTVMALVLTLSASMMACGSQDQTAETPAQENQTVAEETPKAEPVEEAPATEATETPGISGEVMSYEEYMAADVDTPVTVETYVQAKQSWWEDKATLYCQGEDGAYFVYDIACPEDEYDLLTPGTKILVNGYKSEWSGEVEIIDGTFEVLNDGDTYVAEPIDVTELLGTDELINYQNQYVSFQGMTVEASQDADGNDVAFLYNYDGSGTEGDDLYFNVSYNGNTYTFTVESYLCDKTTEVYSAVQSLEVGQTIDMEGFLYWYNGVNPHITSVVVK